MICQGHFWKVGLGTEGCLCFLICCVSNVKKEISSKNFSVVHNCFRVNLKFISMSLETFDDYYLPVCLLCPFLILWNKIYSTLFESTMLIQIFFPLTRYPSFLKTSLWHAMLSCNPSRKPSCTFVPLPLYSYLVLEYSAVLELIYLVI